MAATVKRLRTALLLAAGLLLLVLLAYFVLGRRQEKTARRELPQRLGLNIQQDSNGFTLSKSEHGQTLFTLHAGRAVERTDGAAASLHDVSIVLYGQGNERRRDAISGRDFSYDPKTQTVTSEGAVDIDLQDSAAGGAPNAGTAGIHLRTSGLTFNQQTGQARTARSIQFRLPQLNGTATGADYDARAGTVRLLADVHLMLQLDGGPATLSAVSAELTRENAQIKLLRPVLHTVRRDAAAETAVLWLRPDSSAEKAVADGAVKMTTREGMEVDAPHVVAAFTPGSRLQTLQISGGARLRQPATSGGDARAGMAESADVNFDSVGKAKILRLRGQVGLEEVRSGAQGWRRTLRSQEVAVAFQNGVASRVVAHGSPVFTQVAAGPAPTSRQLKADELVASLRDGRSLTALQGTGNTVVSQTVPGKESDVSTGATLNASFAVGPDQENSAIQNAVQQGNVRFERTLSAPPGSARGDVLVARGQQAEYRADWQTIFLTGGNGAANPEMRETSAQGGVTEASGRVIKIYRDTQQATADGAVKVTYTAQPSATPMHIVAEHVLMAHAPGTATFTGNPRMWQEANSVQAPVITLDQKSQGLIAEGDSRAGGPVRTVLAQQSSRPGQSPQPPMRVRSQKLVYDGNQRRAHFFTNVTLVAPDGTVRADQADVYFKQVQPQQGAPPLQALGGNLDHIVADGNVFFSQPQPRRQGAGEELVYTADDGKFVLTGSAGRRPRMEDALQGTVTGERLEFRSHQDRVDVISGEGRTVSTIRMSK